MIKPRHLEPGDRVAVVSLSSGSLGEPDRIHKYYLAKERLANDFGLELVAMPNALRGIDFLYQHPEARAADLMKAFRDPSIRAVFCAIGGDDTIRLDTNELKEGRWFRRDEVQLQPTDFSLTNEMMKEFKEGRQ